MRLIPGPSLLKGITWIWICVVPSGLAQLNSGARSMLMEPGAGPARAGAGSSVTRANRPVDCVSAVRYETVDVALRSVHVEVAGSNRIRRRLSWDPPAIARSALVKGTVRITGLVSEA